LPGGARFSRQRGSGRQHFAGLLGVFAEMQQHSQQQQPIGVANVFPHPTGNAVQNGVGGQVLTGAEQFAQSGSMSGPVGVEPEAPLEMLNPLAKFPQRDQRPGQSQARLGQIGSRLGGLAITPHSGQKLQASKLLVALGLGPQAATALFGVRDLEKEGRVVLRRLSLFTRR
jgi:hypothetical protein